MCVGRCWTSYEYKSTLKCELARGILTGTVLKEREDVVVFYMLISRCLESSYIFNICPKFYILFNYVSVRHFEIVPLPFLSDRS